MIHSSFSQQIDFTVGGVWQSTNKGWTPNALGGYDPATNRLVIGEFGTTTFHVLDASTMNELGSISLGGGNGEYARGSTVLDGRFYAQYDSINVTSFDISTIGNTQTHVAGFGFYDSLAADPIGKEIYINALNGTSFKVWNTVNNTVTTLANGPNNGNHSSIIFVPVPGPGTGAVLGVAALAAARRRR